MFKYLLLAMTVIPAVEIFILLKFGSYYGANTTFAIILITGISGAILARKQGIITLFNVQSDIAKGKLPAKHLLEGLVIVIGSVFLLTPGLITDIFGFTMILPFSRSIYARILKKAPLQTVFTSKTFSHATRNTTKARRSDIEAEYTRKN